MSTQAQNMLNKFSSISQNSTAPAGIVYGARNGNAEQGLPPTEVGIVSRQTLDDLLNGIPDTLLPPLALADGSSAFDGDATNEWFYPGRSVRSGMLPQFDLV
jgi:hypothetical protein